jgi:hypothetical protein
MVLPSCFVLIAALWPSPPPPRRPWPPPPRRPGRRPPPPVSASPNCVCERCASARCATAARKPRATHHVTGVRQMRRLARERCVGKRKKRTPAHRAQTRAPGCIGARRRLRRGSSSGCRRHARLRRLRRLRRRRRLHGGLARRASCCALTRAGRARAPPRCAALAACSRDGARVNRGGRGRGDWRNRYNSRGHCCVPSAPDLRLAAVLGPLLQRTARAAAMTGAPPPRSHAVLPSHADAPFALHRLCGRAGGGGVRAAGDPDGRHRRRAAALGAW